MKINTVYYKDASSETRFFTFLSGLFLGIAISSFATGMLIDINPLDALAANILPPVFERPADINDGYTRKILLLTNQEREKRGLKPLQENSALTYAAYLRANKIFEENEFSHEATRSAFDSEKVAEVVGYRYRQLGENLAQGFNKPEEAIQKWIQSPKHKDNILSKDFDEIGVAALNGRLWDRETTVVVQLFGRR